MRFQKGNKLGRKFQPGQSGNPAGRPRKWKLLAKKLDNPSVWVLHAAGASLAELEEYVYGKRK